ncbi:CRE-CNC-11 protein [Caenorhabditis remanei]|uniref:CRE-CNC-11 protein n=1 Tax=Caenorhabditis remanei TaxID=31234 RepID=E3LZZ3_CAERE|nr:CRE-CNC-11 protein [Caenorhabditis remanei]
MLRFILILLVGPHRLLFSSMGFVCYGYGPYGGYGAYPHNPGYGAYGGGLLGLLIGKK